jgi:hypothetical protein
VGGDPLSYSRQGGPSRNTSENLIKRTVQIFEGRGHILHPIGQSLQSAVILLVQEQADVIAIRFSPASPLDLSKLPRESEKV